MTYRETFRKTLTKSASKFLTLLEAKSQKRLELAIDLLAKNPSSPRGRKLFQRFGLRIRVRDYRMLYAGNKNELLVAVFKMNHPSSNYRNL